MCSSLRQRGKQLVSLSLILLCTLQLPPLRAEEAEQSSGNNPWLVTNATLLKPVPASLCKPKLKGLFRKRIQSCTSDKLMPAPIRIRLLDQLRIRNKLFLQFQYQLPTMVMTVWGLFEEKASVVLDPSAEMFLPPAPSLPNQKENLLGVWKLDYWDLPKSFPSHTGYMEIDKEEVTNKFTGRFVVKVDGRFNNKGRLRAQVNFSSPSGTYEQSINLDLNGNKLIVKGKIVAANYLSDQMLLTVIGEKLTGFAGTPRKSGQSFKSLPSISFTKIKGASLKSED